MSVQPLKFSRRRGLQLATASLLPLTLTACGSSVSVALIPRSLLEWTMAAAHKLPIHLAAASTAREMNETRPEGDAWLFSDFPDPPNVQPRTSLQLTQIMGGTKRRPSELSALETKHFYDDVGISGVNPGMIGELAEIIGCDAVLECVKQKIPIWIQENHARVPINAVEIVAKNISDSAANGYFDLQIKDSISGRVEYKFRSSSAYSLAPSGQPAVWREVVTFDFLRPGLKTILIEDFGNGVKAEPAEVLVVPVAVT